MMKNRFPLAFVLASLVGAGGIFVAINASAEQSDAAPTSERHQEFSPADRAAFFEAKVAALHAGLTLTPDQEKLWPAVETAVRDTAKTRIEQRKKWRDEPRPSDPVQFLQRVSEGSLARGTSLKKLADALGPLYATLNDDQKRRLPILLAQLRPHRQHFAEAGEHRFGPEGGEHRGGWSRDRHDRDDEDHDHSDEHHHSFDR